MTTLTRMVDPSRRALTTTPSITGNNYTNRAHTVFNGVTVVASQGNADFLQVQANEGQIPVLWTPGSLPRGTASDLDESAVR